MNEFFKSDTGSIILALSILLFTFIIGSLFNRLMKRMLKPDENAFLLDKTPYAFLRRSLVVLIYLIGFSMAVFSVPSLRFFAKSILTGAGILALAVGFASQAALANIVAGVFIVIFKPFRIGDRVTIRETISGIVEDITLRHTVIRNFENRRVIIPNSIISNESILNADLIDQSVCKWIEISITYDSNIDRAKAIMQEEAANHPLFVNRLSVEEIAAGEHPISVRVLSLDQGVARLRAWVWAKNSPDAFVIGCDLNESLKKRFEAEGISLAKPPMDIDLRKNF